MSRTLYLAGPMTGYPESNYPLFHAVTKQLREAGHTVYNPAEFGWTPSEAEPVFPVRKAFVSYCTFICEKADTIVLLPGWQKSVGATAEIALARVCQIDEIEWVGDASLTA